MSGRVGRHFVGPQTAAAAELTRMLSCGPERMNEQMDQSVEPEADGTLVL